MASIRKRGNNYQITVSVGRDTTGKQIIETTTFTPDPSKTEKQNEKALQLFALEFEKKVKDGKYLSGEKITYGEFVKMWMDENIKNNLLSQPTIEMYQTRFDALVLPELGHIKLADLSPMYIKRFYDKLIERGHIVKGQRKDYSPKTIKRFHQMISSSLTAAVYWQLIDENPCKRVKPPKVERQVDVKHFTLEQAQIFIDYLNEPYTVEHWGRRKKDGSPSDRHQEVHRIPLQIITLFNMALFGGFRRGELVALTWDDIDFEHSTVTINKSATRTKKDGLTIKSPKNFSSNRVVSLPENCMQLLKKHRADQLAYKFSLGDYWQEGNFIFTQENGLMMDVDTPNKIFKKTIKRYNESHTEKLPEITLHGLRHTSATLLIAQNVDVKTVSARLGHSETSTTLDIYAHALQKRDAEAAASIGDLFRRQA